MIISGNHNTPLPRQAPTPPQAEAGAPAPADSFFPGTPEPSAAVKCRQAISRLGAGVGAGALGATGLALGLSAGCPLLGAAAGVALGALAGKNLGARFAERIHPQSTIPLTEWQDPAATTPEKAAELKAGITDLQNVLHNAGKTVGLDRGFHQKQTWGGKGHMQFDPDMPEALRAGLLQNVAGESVPTAIRFSNGQGCPLSDARPDVRGMAIKMDIDGQPADLLATNHITFAHDAEQFMKFAKISGVMQTKGPLAALGELGKRVLQGEFHAGEALRIAGNIGKDTLPHNAHVAQESYWTQAVHVGDLVGRFVFTPESGAASEANRKDPDFLRHTLEHDLEAGDVRMRVAFEAFTEDSPARSAHAHGEHVTMPVGHLVLDQRAADSEQRRSEEAAVSHMAFNPSNGFKMAGPFNESNRTEIYKQSAANRGALNWEAPEVQKFFE